MTQYLILSAIAPSFFLVWYFYHRDKNREPIKTVLATFFLGILVVIPVLLVGFPISSFVEGFENPYVKSFGNAFLVAGFPEEFFKYLVLVLFAMRTRAFDEPMDGIVYGAIGSLGFATLENILYVSDGGLGLALLRAVTAVPGHACFGAIMGYFVGQYKFSKQKRPILLLVAYLLPAILHSGYDFPLMVISKIDGFTKQHPEIAGALVLMTLTFLGISMALTVHFVRKLRKEQDMQASIQVPVSQGPFVETFTNTAYGDLGTASFSSGISDSAVVYQPTKMTTGPNRVFGWILLIVGAVLGSVGGIIALALLATVQMKEVSLSDGLISTVIFGVPLLIFGSFLFHRGLRRLRSFQK